MGLLDKSTLYVKQFSASDPLIRVVLQRLHARNEKDLLDGIQIQMSSDIYDELTKRGYFKRRKEDL